MKCVMDKRTLLDYRTCVIDVIVIVSLSLIMIHYDRRRMSFYSNVSAIAKEKPFRTNEKIFRLEAT